MPQEYVYEIHNAQTGKICCAGNEPDFGRCPKCIGQTPSVDRSASTHATTRTERHAELRMATVDDIADYSAPDHFAHDLKILQEQYRTPRSITETEYKIERFTALAAEYRAAAALPTRKSAPRRLTAAEVAEFQPPDPYDTPAIRAAAEIRAAADARTDPDYVVGDGSSPDIYAIALAIEAVRNEDATHTKRGSR